MTKVIVVTTCVFVWAFGNYTSADLVQGIDFEFVTIGNAGNPCDTLSGKDNFGQPINSPYGAVGYEYRIGKYEITNSQWNQFVTQAEFSQGTGAFYQGDQIPTTGVSWYEAVKFCNWLTSGDVNKGAYKADYTVDRAAAIATYGTIYVLPTEDEWYKAAYYKPDGSGYSIYASGSNTDTSGRYGGPSGIGPSNVGMYAKEQNGTFDMMGNVWEWTETWMQENWHQWPVYKGGSFESSGFQLASYHRNHDNPFHEGPTVGFRIATITPEPASLLLLALGGMALRYRRS